MMEDAAKDAVMTSNVCSAVTPFALNGPIEALAPIV